MSSEVMIEKKGLKGAMKMGKFRERRGSWGLVTE